MGDWADPAIMRVGTTYYSCCTGKKRIFKSADLINWTDVGPAITADPAPGWFWAPDLVQKGNEYFLTFTIASSFTGPKSLHVAHSSKPEGPYTPIASPSGGRSLIDSSLFNDNGTIYMFFNEPPSVIKGAVMAPDMRSIASEFTVMNDNREGWQVTPVQEGPFVFKRGSKYYLLFSGHHTVTIGGYAVLCATAPSPRGPWTRQSNNPVVCGICKNQGLVETGHCSAIETPSGNWYLVYHAVVGGGSTRDLCIDKIEFQGDLLTVPGGGIRVPRPYPV